MDTKKKPKTLSVKNLTALFGVTAVTIYNWRKGCGKRIPLPPDPTPAQAARWASTCGVPLLVPDASSLLGEGRLRPGPKPGAKAAAKKGPTSARRPKPSAQASTAKKKATKAVLVARGARP